MNRSVIGDNPPRGGLGGREPPQCVDPLSSWLGRRRLNKKVASIWLKIAKQVAKG